MSDILVLIDHNDDGPRKISLQMLTAARRVAGETGDRVAAVWLGEGADAHTASLGTHGADVVHVWDDDDASAYVTLPKVEALQALVDGGDVRAIFFASSNHTKDVAARLGIRLDAGVITDVVGLEVDGGTINCTKEVFGGATITKSRVAEGKLPIIGISPNAFPVEEPGSAGEVLELDLTVSDEAELSVVTEVVKQASADRPDIAEAAIVVAGGRGLGKEDGFELMEQLADTLGAGVGASRAATDAGWYPHRYQIGQTGRTISPMLYIGSGISGAIQHRAGMQTSQNIVAINKDPEAPIHGIADFGVVGDLYKVVPKLIEEIQRRKG